MPDAGHTTLRERCDAAELAIQQCLGTTGESQKIAQIVEAEARRFAEEALRQVIVLRHGEWWVSEGKRWKVVSVAIDSDRFNTKEAAEERRSRILAAAIDAATRETK